MKLLYPCKTMKITQTYLGHYSHEPNRNGSPPDYPIDEAGVDQNRDWFYAPCGLRISRIFGVGNSGTNTIWMTSKEPVEMPCGTDYVTIMVVHPEDDDLKKLRVSQEFKQGDKMFREGRDGKASGNHFHMSVATGEMKGIGWKRNTKGAWVIQTTGKSLKPEEAFFLPEGINIISSGGLFFEPEPKEEEVDVKKIKVKINGKLTEMEAINHNGNNYVKLRDIADADKNDAFEVSWDASSKTVIIESR